MSDHYYSARPSAPHHRLLLEVTLRGQPLKLYTDQSIFSRKRIDFGTRLLLETISLPAGGLIADVGCGYGPIGLALAKESAKREVILLDINRRAVELARENRALNGISNAQVVESDLLAAVSDKQFDAIVSNPPIRAGKTVVYALFEQSRDRLKSGGTLWLVIQKKQGAPSAVGKLKSLFQQVELVHKKKGYWIIKAIT